MSKVLNVSCIAVWQICLESIKLKQVLLGKNSSNWDVFDSCSEKGPFSPPQHMGPCEPFCHKFSTLQDIVFFYALWSIAHTCQKSVKAFCEWEENVPWQWTLSWQRTMIHSQFSGWGMPSGCAGLQITHTSKDAEGLFYYLCSTQ